MRVLFVLALLALISGCVTNPFEKETPLSQEAATEMVGCDSERRQLATDQCYMDVGVSLNESSVCERIRDSYSQRGCYLKIALKTNDSSMCGEIEHEATRDGCYYRLGVITSN